MFGCMCWCKSTLLLEFCLRINKYVYGDMFECVNDIPKGQAAEEC